MAESGGLENRCVREGTVGSNPTPSARVMSRDIEHTCHAMELNKQFTAFGQKSPTREGWT